MDNAINREGETETEGGGSQVKQFNSPHIIQVFDKYIASNPPMDKPVRVTHRGTTDF